MGHTPYKIAILNSHPIQYFAPLYRHMAADERLDITVFFCSRRGLETSFDEGFGQTVQWDVPLTDGYKHVFLKNWNVRTQYRRFWGLINPGILLQLINGKWDGLIVFGHNFFTYILAIVISHILGIPILTRNDSHIGKIHRRSRLKDGLWHFLVGNLYRSCKACLAIGKRNKEYYQYLGVHNERIFLLPYAVDNDFFYKKCSLVSFPNCD